jgi:hypothetical protein
MDSELKAKVCVLLENLNKLSSSYLYRLEESKHTSIEQTKNIYTINKFVESASEFLNIYTTTLKLKNEVKTTPFYKQSWFLKILALFLTGITGLAGYIFTWNASRNDIAYKELQLQRSNFSKIITEDIEAQKAKMREINDSFYNLKTINLQGIRNCSRTEKYTSDLNMKRFHARMDYVSKANSTFTIFNHEVAEKLLDYAKFDVSVTNLCSPSAPKEGEWFKIQTEINNSYRSLINRERLLLISIYQANSTEQLNQIFIKYLELRNS